MENQVTGIEGLSRRQIAKAQRAMAKVSAKHFIEKHNLFFAYVRNKICSSDSESGIQIDPKGGMVIAYQIPVRGGNLIEISTSICHDVDVFDKVTGKYYASKNFDEGKRITIKLPRRGHYGNQLRVLFEIVAKFTYK